MSYTFTPEQKFAKASGSNMRVSTKSAQVICSAVRRKTLKRAKRLLQDMAAEKRGLDGKYYTKTVKKILELLESCEKNAEFLGLESERLFVHASAHQGATLRRRRRKAAFGSRMKSTNMEIMLIERGKLVEKIQKTRLKAKSGVEKQLDKDKAAARKEIAALKEKSEELKEKTEGLKA